MTKLDRLIAELCPNGVEYKTLDEICILTRGLVMSKDYLRDNAGVYPVYSSQTANRGVFGFINTYDYDCESITWTTDGANAGSVFYHIDEKFSITNVCGLLRPNSENVIMKFIYYILQTTAKSYVNDGMGNPKLMSNVMATVKIPIPPLPIQQEIVRILDIFTGLQTELEAELEARKKQYEHYRNLLFMFTDDIPIVPLGTIGTNLDSKRKPVTKNVRQSGEYPYYGASGIVDYVSYYIFEGDFLLVSEDGANLVARNTPIAFSASGKIWVNNHAHVLQFNTYATRRYIEFYLNSIDLSRFISTAAQPKLNQENLNKIPIPLPSIEEQARIVAILDRFDVLINDITSGLPAEITGRRKQYEYYRDKLLTFKEIA